ncbi:Met_10-domain-containing protein, partial [Fragilariopsis cylindrus CCMP1102]
WITVTEQGIRQSFDLTKVMFSRGNISEKIRFGKTLVQENEIILDMYTGIGYYTLPAIIHGKAAFVYACEWNTYAVNALRYNIKDNKIEKKVKILEGDCREQVEKHNLTNMVDRVSLGLLPSSEGGWRFAIKALKVPTGGWLHIHGNVPAKEMELWTIWVCHRLDVLAKEENKPDNWFILCNHVERVKSFAPTVFHYVADI